MAIVAALHFVWKTGCLGDFKHTFFIHRGHVLHEVKEALIPTKTQSKTIAELMTYITTLCMAEICLADVQAAAVHLDGVAILMELSASFSNSLKHNDLVQIQLSKQFFILLVYLPPTLLLCNHNQHLLIFASKCRKMLYEL